MPCFALRISDKFKAKNIKSGPFNSTIAFCDCNLAYSYCRAHSFLPVLNLFLDSLILGDRGASCSSSLSLQTSRCPETKSRCFGEIVWRDQQRSSTLSCHPVLGGLRGFRPNIFFTCQFVIACYTVLIVYVVFFLFSFLSCLILLLKSPTCCQTPLSITGEYYRLVLT